MIKAAIGWSGLDSKTLVEKAKSRQNRAKRKHQSALLSFAKSVYNEIPEVILNAADQGRGRIAWNMAKSECFKSRCAENKYLLLGATTLSDDEWAFVFDTIVSKLKTEPDIAWKTYDPEQCSTIVLIWNQTAA